MNQDRMVDLLLVRLTKEDEKSKVIDLLVSEFGMTTEEAMEKVDNSPGILKENVSMEQGRILQDRMYPFVDLLPKYYKKESEESAKEDIPEQQPDFDAVVDSIPDDAEVEVPREDSAAGMVEEEVEEPAEEMVEEELEEIEDAPILQNDYGIETGIPSTTEDEDSGSTEEGSEEVGGLYHDQASIMDDEYNHKSYDDEDDESLIITSASEEVISVERCHICGRIPRKNQKLVPCRTCGQLTCVDCYDRKEHVCSKCSAEGKTVDKPLDMIPEEKAEVSREEEGRTPVQKTETAAAAGPGRYRKKQGPKLSPALIIVVVLVVLAIAFFIIDPMGLFKPGADDNSSSGTIPVDSTSVPVQDTVATDSGHDSTMVTVPDSLVSPDSLLSDSASFHPGVLLSEITLPESLFVPDQYPLPSALTQSPVRDITVYAESLQYITEPLAQLSAAYEIELDAFSLVGTETGYDLLLMSILHPEPAEKRAALLGSLGTMLDSTMIDQMVLYYRENQYYDANLFSFTADSFSILSASSSPYFLQRKQALLPETTELITGSIFEWMTDLEP